MVAPAHTFTLCSAQLCTQLIKKRQFILKTKNARRASPACLHSRGGCNEQNIAFSYYYLEQKKGTEGGMRGAC